MNNRASTHGVVLVLVLVVLTISALIGTTVLALTSAERSAVETSLRRTQARALAWSGVQAVMAELAEQREDLLDGRDPFITEEWSVFERPDGTQGVFRLVPLGDGPLPIVSESAKLDVNHVSAEVLSRLPMVDESLAQRIVEARDARPFQSVEELLGVDGIDADLLYGLSGEGDDFGAGFGSGFDGAFDGTGGSSGDEALALADVVTVFSFNPNIQAGLGDDGFRHRGDLRIDLNVPWSDQLGRAIERRYDENVANIVKSLKERGTSFENDATLVGVLRQFNVPPQDWAEVFDVFTSTSDPYLLGRVDLSRASDVVLGCLPGFEDESTPADAVSVRDGLDEETLKSVTWLAAEEVLTPEQFATCVDLVTTRSMQWRVRIEAGLLADDQRMDFGGDMGTDRANPAEADFGSMLAWDEDVDGLVDRVVVEAVIDVSSERPRVAYLRDVTLMDVGRVIRAEIMASQTREDLGADQLAASEQDGADDGLNPDDGVETIGNAIERGVSRGSGSGRTMRSGRSSREVRSSAGESADEESDTMERAQDVPETGPDRRLGRWTTGQGVGR
jgi:Helix-hairpin-helix motif